ncbi:tRNA threonylcarbamoyladenosine biosynthesis protein TsaE [Clostridium acetireducens DSM 10703]|jgi:tRNA threonylcarbamoyladenosine biosynthesis protein TsaE|uniref:tRNA threonylcarbamoyladenosine biosynthesis protein TsaE n=1 Tax=Clostridium acetireducens DSM 10703 TaxID=1121290 RepID=A0A1E8F1C4_9CLOT|nr:tRNA (adenosine(37)-N6)-threonylcarbamoyltransferase complex ATPase subunit type 1 TsaE [Clostridium acetireducens]OFI07429.1 tRNA threonylcarbamoyladenosine biosynthesis protein TsaE [Clostridium acetireducens DSM 10703]
MEFTVKNVEETMAIAYKLGKFANSGDIICLNGDLGTGKTHFVKGLAKGLEIKEHITSPTFNIVNEYDGRIKLYHFDVYRVNDPDEIEAIGFDEYIFGEGVTVIEWSNYIKELIPKEHISVEIIKIPNKNLNYRKIILNYFGEKYNYIKEIFI